MKHSNISIFIPHAGCPNDCSFCNQHHITKAPSLPTGGGVADLLSRQAGQVDPRTSEIAFFGGSFTAIENDYMTELLEAAYPFVKAGHFRGIRISTRPDCIDDNNLNLLKSYGVTSIELGAQSMSDAALLANRRGHTADDVRGSSGKIKAAGFELGLQMMTGLYKSSESDDFYTASEIMQLAPDTVRIYPTIVLKDTRLEVLYLSGEYCPQTLDGAVSLCAELYTRFVSSGIKPIKTGLHAVDIEDYIAGPFSPAFGELVKSEIRLNEIIRTLSGVTGTVKIFVNPAELSITIGQKRKNIEKLTEKGIFVTIKPLHSVPFGGIITE